MKKIEVIHQKKKSEECALIWFLSGELLISTCEEFAAIIQKGFYALRIE